VGWSGSFTWCPHTHGRAMMADVNVYVSDDLKARLQQAKLPVSKLARTAWERALSRAEEDADSIRIETVDRDGADVDLRFEGKRLSGGGGMAGEGGVYRTDDGRAILIFADGSGYAVWTEAEITDDEDGFRDQVWAALDRDYDAFAQVLRAFGVRPVIDL
jgi:hypothetical protein